jgi:LysM repeat protein
MHRLFTLPALMLAATIFSAACDDDSITTPTTPTAPTELVEEFTGTLTVNGAATHPYVVQRVGVTSATINTLEPNAEAVVGIALGTWNGQSCQIIIANDAATTNSAATGQATSIGNFCARISDVGRLTAPTDYKITVRHY